MNKFLDGLAWTILGIFVGVVVALTAYGILTSTSFAVFVAIIAGLGALCWALGRLELLP